ncbi:RNA-guided pseudouridylation complex pseudouridine synthase subunit Cbf5 [Candidatus Woesearchaeota archaeon]|nr:RNA-guided pseudouridylation complex pseudouridine synthase subunit Cbf5 [Candidatus Woesearchaeota archaeon]
MNQLPFEKLKREVLVKREEKGEFGENPEERSLKKLLDYGIVIINKPKGPTSHQTSAFVQKILNIKKSGHSGTLDPAVTGVLPVTLGKGTKVVTALINAGKEYVALMHLHDQHKLTDIKKIFKKMTGKIKQLPPVKSAIKRQWRYRTIYYVDLIEVEEQDILFRIGCEAGTYIRKYIHDFGQNIGSGAHMQQLVRTKAGPFNDNDMITLQDLTDAYHYATKDGDEQKLREIIKPIETAVEYFPKIWISDSAILSVLNGVDLKIPGIVKLNSDIEPDQKVAIMSLKNELIAFGDAKLTSKKIFDGDKGVAVEITRVLYPRD